MDPRPLYTMAWQHLRTDGSCGVFVHRVGHDADVAEHDHLFHEVVYVEAGSAEHVVVDGRTKLRPGDVIVIRPQVWHAYRRPRGLRIVNCLIDSRLMQRLAGLLEGVDGAFDLFRRRVPRPHNTSPVVLHASPGLRQALVDRLETVMAEQRGRRNGWQAAATASLLDVLVTVARLSRHGDDGGGDRRASVSRAGRTEEAVLDTASYLEGHFAEPVRLDGLARRVDLSPAHLSRSFSRRMGMGIVEFVHRARAEEACRLLRMTQEPVSRIAARVGYDEIAYFSRCFRNQVGQSPRAYRRAWHS